MKFQVNIKSTKKNDMSKNITLPVPGTFQLFNN